MITNQTIIESQEFAEFLEAEFGRMRRGFQAELLFGNQEDAIEAFKESENWEFFEHCHGE